MNSRTASPMISISLRPFFFFASIWLFLTWSIIVIVTRVLQVNDPEGARGMSLVIPLIADATRHPTLHPFFSVVMSVAQAMVVSTTVLHLIVSQPDPAQNSQGVAVALGFLLIASFFSFLNASTFVETVLHLVSKLLTVGELLQKSLLFT